MTEVCPGCGATLSPHAGATHPYFGASPSCWALYGEVLAREYGDPAMMAVHRFTVDAYAVQHPGIPERRSTQSVWVHLASLYLTLERGLSHGFARKVIGILANEAEDFVWLDPPADLGSVTIVDVAAADTPTAHIAAVQAWAGAAWTAWQPHHATIAALSDRTIARL
ncbi:MAG: DUF5946 family protein [Sphingomonas taxi]